MWMCCWKAKPAPAKIRWRAASTNAPAAVARWCRSTAARSRKPSAESELFGVVSGAYTGASHSRPGYIEAANNGILFLDEIDSMPLTVQAKLLRMLETRAIERLGSTRCIPLTLRVIAAAQTPLEQLVTQGRFRRDLYFRLNTITLATPTVRSRPELIIPLFRQFTQDAAQRLDQPLPPRAPGAGRSVAAAQLAGQHPGAESGGGALCVRAAAALPAGDPAGGIDRPERASAPH